MVDSLTSLDALRFWHQVVSRGLRDLPYDLSQRQIAVLLGVYITPPPHTVKNMTERLGISKPAICRAVDALSALDLVKRKKDEVDKRNVFLQRTIAGSVFLRDFADIILQETKTMVAPAELPVALSA